MEKYSEIVKTKKAGFTIIEALTVLFIFSIITMTFYGVISQGSRYLLNAKNRLGATVLANKKLEIIRNLPYDKIGVTGGEVSGDIPQYETVLENGKSFDVHTVVKYVQDDFDGVAPADTAWNDYKKAIVTVSWSDGGISSSVMLTGRFAPPGLEVANPGDGILIINVFSDQPGGVGIPSSSVHVVNTETGLDTTQNTGADGTLMLLGDTVTDSIKKYQVFLSKSGYETVQTYPPYPDTAYNPVDVHGSVVSGVVNVLNIVQNKIANLKVRTEDSLGQPIASIDFSVKGGRKMGTDTADPPNFIYNKDSNEITNTSGEKDFGAISPGQYDFLILAPDSDNYELIGSDPESPLLLMSEDDITYKLKLAEKIKTSLLVNIIDQTAGTPIKNAEVHVTNGSGYDSGVISTLYNGNAYFPVTADPFVAGTYDISVHIDGYVDHTEQVTVTDGQLLKQTIGLTQL